MIRNVLTKEEVQKTLEDAFAPEELNLALEPFIYKTKSGWNMLNHPLVQCVMYDPRMNKSLNHMYARKLELIREAIRDNEWNSYVFLHERPYRARALAGVMHKIPGDLYWPLLAEVWMDTENIWQWGHLKRKLLLAQKPHRHLLMNDAEQKVLGGFDEVAPLIFRGYTPPGRPRGWSWTLDRDKAEWFARRFMFGKVPRVVVGEVKVKDIIAYFEGRNEWEIVVDPRRVNILGKPEEIPVVRSKSGR